ncbi:LIM domain protein, partial [Teladorsagia circumcincta]
GEGGCQGLFRVVKPDFIIREPLKALAISVGTSNALCNQDNPRNLVCCPDDSRLALWHACGFNYDAIAIAVQPHYGYMYPREFPGTLATLIGLLWSRFKSSKRQKTNLSPKKIDNQMLHTLDEKCSIHHVACLIFAGEYTKALNKDWHSDHFCCWQCDQTLTGQRYIMRDEQPYCIKCYEDVFANQCDECAKPIGIDSKFLEVSYCEAADGKMEQHLRRLDLSYKDKHWHEHCFLCNMCKISLVDMPFGSKNDRIFCSNCYDQAFATRCDGCNEIFRAGMKKMEYKGKQWHDKCFCCAHCKNPIGTKSFIPKNEDVYCGSCYEEKFATRCNKCRKDNDSRVKMKNRIVRIVMVNCLRSDAMPARSPSPGFITDGTDILCPECAKARLMSANS